MGCVVKRAVKFPLILKIIMLVVVAYAAITLVCLRNQIAEKKAEAAALTTSITEAEQGNRRIIAKTEALATDEGVEDVARNQLGLVGAGEIVIRDVGN